MLKSIQFFKKIIILAFKCDFCGYRISKLKKEEEQVKKQKNKLKVEEPDNLNRDVFNN